MLGGVGHVPAAVAEQLDQVHLVAQGLYRPGMRLGLFLVAASTAATLGWGGTAAWGMHVAARDAPRVARFLDDASGPVGGGPDPADQHTMRLHPDQVRGEGDRACVWISAQRPVSKADANAGNAVGSLTGRYLESVRQQDLVLADSSRSAISSAAWTDLCPAQWRRVLRINPRDD